MSFLLVMSADASLKKVVKSCGTSFNSSKHMLHSQCAQTTADNEFVIIIVQKAKENCLFSSPLLYKYLESFCLVIILSCL